MGERLYVGILPVHGNNEIFEGTRKREVKKEIAERIGILKQSYPNYNFQRKTRIYRAERTK